jgi:hypothetical protein
MKETYTCRHCQTVFTRKRVQPTYCGRACFDSARQLASNPVAVKAKRARQVAAYRARKRQAGAE